MKNGKQELVLCLGDKMCRKANSVAIDASGNLDCSAPAKQCGVPKIILSWEGPKRDTESGTNQKMKLQTDQGITTYITAYKL